MKGRSYVVYDVFTDTPLAGNPLAVVREADGLDTPAMQAIAARVQPFGDRVHAAGRRLRGTAPKSASSRRATSCPLPAIRRSARRSRLPNSPAKAGTAGIFVLEESVGPVRCAVSERRRHELCRIRPAAARRAGRVSGAAGRRWPQRSAWTPHEIGFENHRIAALVGRRPYVTVPVRGPGGRRPRRRLKPRVGRAGAAARPCWSPPLTSIAARLRAPRQRLPRAHVRRP